MIIRSIPGFGFSTPLSGPQWTTKGIAGAWLELMARLGYERFAVQGGDLGAGGHFAALEEPDTLVRTSATSSTRCGPDPESVTVNEFGGLVADSGVGHQPAERDHSGTPGRSTAFRDVTEDSMVPNRTVGLPFVHGKCVIAWPTAHPVAR